LPIGRSYKNVVPYLLNSSEEIGGIWLFLSFGHPIRWFLNIVIR
jgi:hypothetical protein